MTGAFEFDDLPDWDLLRMRLSYGVQNAITQPALARACGLSVRAVQEALEGAKRAGVPVVTGSPGVWLTSDASELRAAYRRDRSRALRQLQNNRGRLKAIEAIEGVKPETVHQETLFGEAA